MAAIRRTPKNLNSVAARSETRRRYCCTIDCPLGSERRPTQPTSRRLRHDLVDHAAAAVEWPVPPLTEGEVRCTLDILIDRPAREHRHRGPDWRRDHLVTL